VARADAWLLETSRSHWQYGVWEKLAEIDTAALSDHPDRAKLALLSAAGHLQAGAHEQARRAVRQALDWGADRSLTARVLAASLHNTLGRVAVLLEDDAGAATHFRQSITIVEPGADVTLLTGTRQVRETARLGLMEHAARAMQRGLEQTVQQVSATDARLIILKSEMEVLQSELRLAMQRGQVSAGNQLAAVAAPKEFKTALKERAVSQLGQDLWVLERSQFKRGGYFVEFGATDGVMLSNTWLLETEFDWTGICAEPNPAFLEQLRRNRRCVVSDACIGPVSGETVEFILADVYGSIASYADSDKHSDKRAAYLAEGNVLQMTTKSLEDLLIEHAAPRDIDYLSIDTEGSEYDILRSFPFSDWRIRLLTVEHNFAPQRELIHTLLAGYGYRRTEVRWDDWYELAG